MRPQPNRILKWAVRVDGAADLLGHEVVHHAQEAGNKEEAHRIVAIPPLHHGIDCTVDLSHGIDPRPVRVHREEKSVGTESTFFDTLTEREDARRVLLDQSQS